MQAVNRTGSERARGRAALMTGAVLALAGGGWHGPARAQTAYPMLMSVAPTALQMGTSGTATIASRYALDGATAVLVSGAGVTGTVVPPPAEAPAADATTGAAPAAKPKPKESLEVVLTAASDAVPGIRDVRVVTPLGVSTVGQLLVVRDPVVAETPPSGKPPAAGEPPAAPQEVPVPAAVCGTIAKAEEVDRYRFRVEPGAALGFNVWCMRLEDRVHDLQQHADPILVVRDARGAVVASSDNEFNGDPALWHTFREGGEHTLEIRDVRYLGNTHWTYCIEVSARPIVRTVFPGAVAAAATPALAPLGLGTPAGSGARLLGAAPPPGLHETTLEIEGLGAFRQRLVVTDGTPADEAAGDNDTVEAAATITVPAVLNGRLDREGDVDCFAFEARKGQQFDVEVFAARLGAAVDVHLRILDDKGRQLALSDDVTIGKRRVTDAAVEGWTAPADGRYVIEVRDLHLRGGEPFVYALEVRESRPSFELFADTDKTLIAPGTTGVLFVRAARRNGFNGAIQLAVDGLPEGVTASCGRILPGKGQDGCIVFTATADARPLAAPIRILGSGRHEGDAAAPELTATAAVYQETYLPGGGRGHWPVEAHVVSVSAPGDLRRVTVGETALQLAPGERRAVEIEIERAEGFTANVLLEATYSHLGGVFGNSLPEGVTVDASQSETLLTGGATKGRIMLVAAPTAPEAAGQQFVIMANVSLNFVMKRTYGSQPVSITIAK